MSLINSSTRVNQSCKVDGLSPLPKPDFTSIEQKENSINFHMKGSYKRKKSNIPESPIKKNQKYFTPLKIQNVANQGSDSSVSKKLVFGTEDNLKTANYNMFQFTANNTNTNSNTNNNYFTSKRLNFSELVINEEDNQSDKSNNLSMIKNNINQVNLMSSFNKQSSNENEGMLFCNKTPIKGGNQFNNMNKSDLPVQPYNLNSPIAKQKTAVFNYGYEDQSGSHKKNIFPKHLAERASGQFNQITEIDQPSTNHLSYSNNPDSSQHCNYNSSYNLMEESSVQYPQLNYKFSFSNSNGKVRANTMNSNESCNSNSKNFTFSNKNFNNMLNQANMVQPQLKSNIFQGPQSNFQLNIERPLFSQVNTTTTDELHVGNKNTSTFSFFNKKNSSTNSGGKLLNKINSGYFFDSNFSIIKTLDEGSFGIVYLCLNVQDNNYYAIKQSKKSKNQ